MASTRPGADAFDIAVFAKAPVAGEVKTRLVPPLEAGEAAALHQWLVRRALQTATRSGARNVTLWCAPDHSHAFFAECERDFRVTLHAQSGADLGERMASAFETLTGNAPVLLIGSDCPALTEKDLQRAAASLVTHDVVLQPAEDGGYVMVGKRRACPAIFAGIEWGRATVMRETRRRLREEGVTWREMPTRWDVDRPADYERLKALGWYPGKSS